MTTTDLTKTEEPVTILDPNDYRGTDLKRGDHFMITVPELVVSNISGDYINFSPASPVLRGDGLDYPSLSGSPRGNSRAWAYPESALNVRDHFPFLFTRVYQAGEIAVTNDGMMWGFNGKSWQNGKAEEISTQQLRDKGARILPTEQL